MARLNKYCIPGAEVSAIPAYGNETVVSFKIVNARKLLWYVVQRYITVRWWAWPLVVLTIFKCSLLHRMGRWPDHTSRNT